MSTPQSHPAVILTLSATGLAVARSLAPRGVKVWGVDSEPQALGHSSRWVSGDPRFASLPAGPELLAALMKFGSEQEHRPVIYTAGDPYIDFVADHNQALRDHFILMQSMKPEVSSLLMDKQTFYGRCEGLGIVMPRTFFPEDQADAERAAAEVRYPAIVKPTQGHLFRRHLGGEKLVEVEDSAGLVRWWQQFRDWGGDSVLQEVIPGPETNIFVAGLYTDAQFKCRSLFTARKSRQYPPRYGSGSYMEACWSQEIADLSLELVAKLRYSGICGTEYKWDPRDEAWKLIELNPRPTLWYSLPRAAGVDVVWDAHCDLTGNPNPVHIDEQDDSVRWQLPVRDLLASWHFLRTRELGLLEFLRTTLDPRNKDFGDLALSDPGMLLAVPRDVISKYFTHVRRPTDRTDGPPRPSQSGDSE
ncbi:MAG: hypothetical protein GY725_25260 [bacterium]|nr:hypothetical protein [bacterium]